MRKIRSLSVVCLLTAAMLSGCGQTAPAASITTSGTETKPADTPKQAENKPLQVSLAVAGDTVMTDLMEKAVAPDFKKKYEGAEVAVVGTGPGDAGSQKKLWKS